VITVISYSLDNFEILITNDKKYDIGKVNNKICGTVYKYKLNSSIKFILITEVKDTILTKKTTEVIKKSPKNIGKKLIANCECK
jgi:hypothetical protein